MSKLGKKPIQIPKDTKVKVESGKLIVTGPKGSKEMNINEEILTKNQSISIISSVCFDQVDKFRFLNYVNLL